MTTSHFNFLSHGFSLSFQVRVLFNFAFIRHFYPKAIYKRKANLASKENKQKKKTLVREKNLEMEQKSTEEMLTLFTGRNQWVRGNAEGDIVQVRKSS